MKEGIRQSMAFHVAVWRATLLSINGGNLVDHFDWPWRRLAAAFDEVTDDTIRRTIREAEERR